MYNEISQILAMYERYRNHSQSKLFTKLKAEDPEWEQKTVIKKYINLTNWFFQTMKNNEEVGTALSKYDNLFKEDLNR